MLVPIIRYASRSVGLFSFSIVTIAVLELLENEGILTKESEGFIRILTAGTATLLLAAITIRAPFSYRLRAIIICGCCLVFAGHLQSYTEHVESWNDVPLFGHESRLRRQLDPLISAGWVLTLVYIAYRSVKSLTLFHSESLRQERLRAVGEMTSGITHDLNNALTPLVGAAELLMTSLPNPDPRQKRLLNLLDKAAHDLSGIVERVSHFRAKDRTDTPETVCLRSLVSESFDGIMPKLKTQSELDGVTVELINQVIETPVIVNPTEIRVLLTNLLFNALQVMPDGGRIEVRNYFRGTTMYVDVVDTGFGMDREQLRRCTEPFYTTRSSGSGLGLATCQQIVESYGARLEVASTPGRGTTVTFSLPVNTKATVSAVPTGRSTDTPGRSVLLVEDEPEVRRTILLMLQQLGASVQESSSGQQALQEFGQREFDLVLTDFGLNDMTGAELIRRIRLIRADQAIVVVSGWGAESVKNRCRTVATPDRLLKKPVSIDELRRALSDMPLQRTSITKIGA